MTSPIFANMVDINFSDWLLAECAKGNIGFEQASVDRLVLTG